ncbi:hypothetical protein FACS1894166_01820 [Bacilli bacterium]|nr:hypothetical protein FACS1894166_01820 [Bacilli bacterium]
MNFGDESNIKAYDPYHTSNSWPLLERLKKLNAVAAGTSNGKTITPFAGSDYEIKDKNLHVGGFPKRPANTNTGEPK